MTAMRWGRRIATGVVLVSLVAIGLGRGVGAQTGPAFSAQIQLALRALLAGDQTITGNWTCSGTCSGFGGGTPASPDTSVQFNNGGSFGGSASLTWDGTTLLGNSFVTAATDTGATFQGNATKLLLKTATGGPYALAMQNASIDPAHYGSSWFVDNEGTTWWSAGKDQELLLAPTPSTSADPVWANSWQVKGDLLDYSGSTYSLGRASNPWAAVYANAYRGQSTGTTIESYQQPPATPADPVLAGAGAGNVNNGTHRYVFTFSDSDGHETSPSAPTGAVTVTDNTTNGKVTVTVPYVCNVLLPNQNIYRDFNGDGVFKLAHAGAFDCMSTWEDDVANADLGATAPATSTALLPFTFAGEMLTVPYSSDWGGRMLTVPNDFSAEIRMADKPTGNSPGLYIQGGYANNGDGGSVDVNGGGAANGNGGGLSLFAGFGDGGGHNGGLTRIGGGSASGVGGVAGDLQLRGGPGFDGATAGAVRVFIDNVERLNIIGSVMTGDVDFDLAAHFQQFTEISAPAAPSANQGRLFLQDNGAGKSQLCVRFNTGAAQCFATEP